VSDNRHFNQLVQSGKPVGEVVAINRFLIKVKGLQPVNINALIMFEDGSKGFVYQIAQDYVVVLHMGTGNLQIGMVAVVQYEQLVTKVGEDFKGRIISVNGEPLDGKGPVASDGVRPVFSAAPSLNQREVLDTQLPTGVTVLDTLFPLLRGQRLAILGDGKSGKSTLATQLALNQKNTDVTVVYALIAKRKSDVDELINRLSNAGALENSIVVVSTMADSLIMSYLAPYVACSIAEHLWQTKNQDVLVVYDDLTAHAHAYREIALLAGMSPGRDSYPGDMFYVHSSLLERAGRLASNHKTLTAVPLVFTAGGDVTAYLPTNIMSITDGQWILDMEVFRERMRPAVSVGLSVSRVGGRGQTSHQKKQNALVFKALTDYAQAQEFARFGSELGMNAQEDLNRGDQLYKVLNQAPNESYDIAAQLLMLDVALAVDGSALNVETLKKGATEEAPKIRTDQDYDQSLQGLKKQSLIQSSVSPLPAAQPTSGDKK
jgi:F-type H+/Na+-transporting ATPase subunit alpha